LWGRILQPFLKPEGELFPSFTALLLAGVAVGIHVRAGRAGTAHQKSTLVRWSIWILGAVAATHLAAAAIILAGAGGLIRLGPLEISLRNFWRVVALAGVSGAGVLALSPRLRRIVRGDRASALTFFMVVTVAAMFLSFGPTITAMGRRLGTGPYLLLYDYVPGFDGLRAPARYGMLVILGLSVGAAYGAAAIARLRHGKAILFLVAICFLAESTAAPIPLNTVARESDVATPPGEVPTGDRIPKAYQFLRTLPADAVIAHFPFGFDAYELRYVYFSTAHWRRILNGYSGHFPDSYWNNVASLQRILDDPEAAWTTLSSSGATHAVVHKGAFLAQQGGQVARWLQSHGAVRVFAADGDEVYRLR
jgi:hypothetical protein